jgi:hypothetical protein
VRGGNEFNGASLPPARRNKPFSRSGVNAEASEAVAANHRRRIKAD